MPSEPTKDHIAELWQKAQNAGITRRRFLALLALGGTTAVLAACGQSISLSPTQPGTTKGTASTTQPTSGVSAKPVLVAIPGGHFERGDHHGYVDPGHGSDEVPLRVIGISPFLAGKFDITVSQYCDALNWALSQKLITVSGGSAICDGLIAVTDGLVFLPGGKDVLFQTRQADKYSRIDWDGKKFAVLDNRGDHPVTSVMWYGAAAYCNWLSQQEGFQLVYDTATWEYDLSKNGYRLLTEAEWEYAGRGGQYNPYYNFPWGDDADVTKANWPGSGDPWETGPLPKTTPVGFYNGQLRKKSDFNWPGAMETYQTGNGANAWGLYDMSGNIWQHINDWYRREYYNECPAADPPGPPQSKASPCPDRILYHGMRGGNWYNGEADIKNPKVDTGHGRVSNRDPGYYRGPQDPYHSYYHVGFRIARRDPPFAKLAPPTLISDKYQFTEGPLWDKARNVFLFCDYNANKIYQLALPDTVTVFREPSNKAYALAFDQQGRLLAAEGGGRRISRTLSNGTVETVVDKYQGLAFNAPNDLVVRSDGTIYFTDPIFGPANTPKGVDFMGLYRLSPTGELTLEGKFENPNGLALSPDEKTLYLCLTFANQVTTFFVAKDGALSNNKKFVDAKNADGMKVDTVGNLYVACMDGIYIFAPDGTPITSIKTADRATNCAFGGPNGNTLLITATKNLYRLDMPIAGL